jgi:hypothetical protein
MISKVLNSVSPKNDETSSFRDHVVPRLHGRGLAEVRLKRRRMVRPSYRFDSRRWLDRSEGSPKDIAPAFVCVPSPVAAARVPAEKVESRLRLHEAVAEALVAATPAVA